MTREEFEAIWDDLASEGRGGQRDGMTRRRIAPGSNVNLFLCVLWPLGKWALLIEGKKSKARKLPKTPDSRGISSEFRKVQGKGGKRLSLLIILEQTDFQDLFAIFGSSLLPQLSQLDDEDEAFASAVSYLIRWKKLMDSREEDGLSATKQYGLTGELYVLKHLMLPALEELDAVVAWYGPSAAPQDFVHLDASVEVKTTTTKKHSKLTIQSEKQLDDSIFRALMLVHVRLDESAKGTSLPDLVKEIRDDLSESPLALNELNMKLIEAGYLDEHYERYKDKHYVINKPKIYRVHKNFPRMVDTGIPDGVGDVRYSIVAGTLGDFLIPQKEFDNLLGGGDD